MRAHRTLLAAAALILAAQAALADVDLVAAWEAAQRQDPAYAAARAEADAGPARGRQGRALLLPSLTVSGTVGYGAATQSSSGAQFSGPGFGTVNGVDFRTDINDGTAAGWRITAEQPIYNAERRASARQLELSADRAEMSLRLARQDLMLRTARAYFDVLLAEDTLAEIERRKAATARALEVAQGSYDEGKLPITDRTEARARYDGILASESAARDALELARAAFTDLTGLPAEDLRAIPPEGVLRAFDAGRLDQWLAKAGEGNPQVAMQSLARDIAAAEVEKWSARAAPTLSLIAQAGGDRLSGNGAFGTSSTVSANNSVIGLQLAIPLYTGGMRAARGDEAVALAEKARYDVEATRKSLSLKTRGAWLGATSGPTRIEAYQRAVDSARSRLDATETGHEVGARTTLDLLNAQADLFRALRDLSQARYQVLLDRLALVRAAGELGDADLVAVNSNLVRR
ncbi:MAG TPA: TolC family outer membrane protein [Casimicrobiaceae bacterium]|nr:TolC family outer membrane protein [Casimicrobiaceae bacterium]